MKCIYNSRSIRIELNNKTTTNNNTTIYNINFIISKKQFQYKIIIHNKYDGTSFLDVIPLKIITLNEIEGYNYYNNNIINDIMNINNNNNVKNKLLNIAEILIKSIVNKEVVHYNLNRWKDNVKLSFMLSFFSDIEDVSILTYNTNNNNNNHDRIDSTHTIVIETPIISYMQRTEITEYFIDTVKINPILLSITINVQSKEITLIRTDIIIPSNIFRCSSKLELNAVFRDNRVNDFKIEDVCTNLEKKIIRQWYYRKRFTEELVKNSAVLEYDTIDFSFILLGIRIKCNSSFASCTVSFTFKEPAMPVPKVVLHEMLRFFDKDLDTSSISSDNNQPDKTANELLDYITRSIKKEAFDI